MNKNNIVFIITAVTVVAAVNFLRFFYNHGDNDTNATKSVAFVEI